MAKDSMTSFDKDISMELKENEEMLWRGVPQKASFVLSKSVQLLPIALIWLCFDGFAISMIFRSDIPKGVLPFLIVFFAFHLLPVWMWIYQILSARKKHKLIEYAFTNQRVIVREQGIVKSYYYRNLRRVSVKVGLIDKLFKVGDITLFGSRSVTLLDIDNPYVVGNKLQQFIEAHEGERKQRAENRNKDTEYEDYFENTNLFPNDAYEDEDTYDEDGEDFYRYDKPQDKRNDFEKENVSSSGRYTSKKSSAPSDKNEEDDYLDNIMDSINKKDEF